MRNTDLKGIVVESRQESDRHTSILLIEKLEKVMAGSQTLLWRVHHGEWIAYRFVELLDIGTSLVARLDRVRRLRAKLTGAFKTETVPEFSAVKSGFS